MTVVAAADHAPHKSVMSDPLICTRAWSLPLGSIEYLQSISLPQQLSLIMTRLIQLGLLFLCACYKNSKICIYQEQESLKRLEVRYVLHSTIMDVNRYDAYDISLFYLYAV